MKFQQHLFWLAPSVFNLAVVHAAEKKTVASQLGPYPVTISDHEVKTNRTDKLAPTPQQRRLMVTVYRPHTDVFACPQAAQQYIPYAPDAVAQGLEGLLSGTHGVGAADYEQLQRINCTADLGSSAKKSSKAPVVLFSHGLQSSRYVHTSLLQAVASSGYTVVAVDHTWDAVAVVFPDGQVIPSNLTDPSLTTGDFPGLDRYIGDVVQPVRQADLVSVLDALENNVIPGAEGSSKPLKAAVFGHSVGGSTAAGAVKDISRLVGGLNMDGTFFGPIRNATIPKPFYMMSESDGPDTYTWPGVYSDVLKNWKSWTIFNNTVHLSFTDLPVVVDLLNKRLGPDAAANTTEHLTGAINSQRNLEITWSYIVSFLDFVLKGDQPRLLEKARRRFPDVQLVAHAG